MRSKTKPLDTILFFLLFLLSGCIHQPSHTVDMQKYNLDIEYEQNGTDRTIVLGENKETPTQTVVNEIEEVPQFVKPGKVPKKLGTGKEIPLTEPDKMVRISVEDIPIGKFINLIFGEILQLNYTVDERVAKRKERVTLRMEEKLPARKLYVMVESLLDNYGIVIRYKDGIFFVKSGKSIEKSRLDFRISIGRKLQFDDVPDNEIIFQVAPLEYLQLDKAQSLAYQFALSKKIGRIVTLQNLNALLIKDYAKNVRKALELLSIFDKPYMKKKDFKLVRLEHIAIEKFDKRIRQIFETMNIPVADTILGEAVTLMPIEEINSMLVITDKPEIIQTMLYWKKKLDNFEELEDKRQLFVYKTKNRDAEEIKKILDEILKYEQESARLERKTPKGVAKTAAVSGSVGGKEGTLEVKKFLPTGAKITVDKERNKLIFYMKPSGYKQIYEVLKQIDTKPRQILLEVTIAEVTLTDKLQYGVEWYLQNNSDKWGWTLGTLDGLGLGSGGITGTIVKYGDFQAVLNAFAQDNILHILSTPKLVVLNNKSASFNVGTQVPVITSQSTAPDLTNPGEQPSILQNVTYTTTGVITNITPTITADNTIILKINQTVSEAQTNNTSDISSPIIINRSLETEVILQNGQELILGGLIKENRSTTDSKVPILGDIPILGYAFKTTSETNDRTELLFIVRPHILGSEKKNEAALKAFKDLAKYL